MICDAQYMMLFEIVIDTALWQYFSDLWWNLIVMDQQIFCSDAYATDYYCSLTTYDIL